ncbi:guanine deaminase [Brucella endophytica]|uniref:Guanine deaminase n=1 Tax=Brucella endophytica TaxID=1963359 RepID=A0A916S971_9HYPH|nr:guanine deaminase [Brucella endophytica]GGA89769.1 guanine deaminase [Brucella endophytica]
MTELLIRGRVLTFIEEPRDIADTVSCRYVEDGALLVRDGKIAAMGDYADIARLAGEGTPIADHRPHLVVPGLIDAHIHFPQVQAVASYAAQLLEWLNTYTFIEEQKFADEQHAEFIAERFMDELLRHGTTTVAAYCTVHPQSVDAFFRAAERRDMCVIGGKVMMDRNAPPALLDTAQSGYDDTKALIARWQGKGRLHYAITPRFAITSTPEQMEMSGALAREHPDCYIQTHLSENHEEIALTRSLYPDAPDYTGIYEHYGLLGSKTLLGHCIHLTERETKVLAETGSVAVFCPTSNLFLGSGLFDRARLQAEGVRIAVATDIGGGTSFSMLKTMDEAYKVLQLRGQRLSPLHSFYMMTLGNARALSLEDRIGTLEPGTDADITILDARATAAMRMRMETVRTLAEELFLLQTLGDDRAVAEVYVAGKAMKKDI